MRWKQEGHQEEESGEDRGWRMENAQASEVYD